MTFCTAPSPTELYGGLEINVVVTSTGSLVAKLLKQSVASDSSVSSGNEEHNATVKGLFL